MIVCNGSEKDSKKYHTKCLHEFIFFSRINSAYSFENRIVSFKQASSIHYSTILLSRILFLILNFTKFNFVMFLLFIWYRKYVG